LLKATLGIPLRTLAFAMAHLHRNDSPGSEKFRRRSYAGRVVSNNRSGRW
jgi:hypothetical protein